MQAEGRGWLQSAEIDLMREVKELSHIDRTHDVDLGVNEPADMYEPD